MPTLRLTQSTVGAESFSVEAILEGDSLSRRAARADFPFVITSQDREDLRWYVEDYLQYAADPAPQIAARIENRIAQIGISLFAAVFQSNDAMRGLWTALDQQYDNLRVEVIADAGEATSLPWELLRVPDTNRPLALCVRAFVRAPGKAIRLSHPLTNTFGTLRILLVICRPGGGDDVPFRSVANRLIKGLSQSVRKGFQLDILRPPTFSRLGQVLEAAKVSGKPYHVVHFDGHGVYEDVNARYSGQVATNPRGYISFENADLKGNQEFVHGEQLGELLVKTDVSVLVLNACRSAHFEAPASPNLASTTAGPASQITDTDVHTPVRAFGSLAQEVMDAGVTGVVAMRYNIYVVTAAQFVADLYESLASGWALGAAVTLSRKRLEAQPLREIAYEPRPLQDWMVPVVYEVIAETESPRPWGERTIAVAANAILPSLSAFSLELEKRPIAGFFGRDETLLALDRAFDSQALVLLHAYAGSGKTSAAVEFARWYHLTGGVAGPVLFTSFQQYKSFVQALNETIGAAFADELLQEGVNWFALTESERISKGLEVMTKHPVLWIWDNVEPIAGFPKGTLSAWNDGEQQALRDFLFSARNTRAKILLTSRHDERDWLGHSVQRIKVPPMPMLERVQMARALSEKQGGQLTKPEIWLPLLDFTAGNPLTITVLLSQAIRNGLSTKADTDALVAKLRAGEAVFTDEETEGREKSLGASLRYGFEQFNETERLRLALLHLFHGYVDVRCLGYMANPQTDFCVPEVKGTTLAVWRDLLERASSIGMLTSHGNGLFTVHPAIPWFFRELFEASYSHSKEIAMRAFVDAIGQMGNLFAARHDDGELGLIVELGFQEANLLHARSLARTHNWWAELSHVMVGLRCLYLRHSRNQEWKRLIDDLISDLVDPTTGNPLPGREDVWSVFTDSRVRLAMEERRLDDAEKLQRACLRWDQKAAASALFKPANHLSEAEQNAIERVGLAEELLGHILREQDNVESTSHYESAIKHFHFIGKTQAEGSAVFNLAHAYLKAETMRDLDQAEQCYKRCMQLWHHKQGRAACLGQLGLIAYQRFRDMREADRSEVGLISQLTTAAEFTQQSLALMPEEAAEDRAVAHNSLGNIFGEIGDVVRAMQQYQEAVKYLESGQSIGGAASVRVNMARLLRDHGKFADALAYAQAALRNFQQFGDHAIDEIENVQSLISELQKQQ